MNLRYSRTAMLMLILITLVVAQLSCASNTGGIVESTVFPTRTLVPPVIYSVGDTIHTNKHTIVLNSATVGDGVLTANFTVINLDEEDLIVSSLLSFSARDEDGTDLKQSFSTCDATLDGKVLPQDKLKGNICWKMKGKIAKIYYEPSLLGEGAVVWQVQP